MSADDNAPEQAWEVEVVRAALLESLGWDWTEEPPHVPSPEQAVEGVAEAVLAALELTEETDVDWCESENWWDPYRDGSGWWEKCKHTADHVGEHRGVNGQSWPRDLQDPEDQPKPRRRRLVGPWRDVPRADDVTGRRGT